MAEVFDVNGVVGLAGQVFDVPYAASVNDIIAILRSSVSDDCNEHCIHVVELLIQHLTDLTNVDQLTILQSDTSPERASTVYKVGQRVLVAGVIRRIDEKDLEMPYFIEGEGYSFGVALTNFAHCKAYGGSTAP